MYFNSWTNITTDKWILKTISGYNVELFKKPKQKLVPKPLQFSKEESKKISDEIDQMLKKGIITPVPDSEPTTDEYISNIFTRPKKDGRVRVILNLKHFNADFMKKFHFKMETLQSAIDSLRKDCYFASVDLAEAFYSVPLLHEDRKYFRFFHNSTKYQFTALVMGLTSSPRIFTKLLKPVFATLRSWGHISTAYIDDSCLQGLTYGECLINVRDTVKLLDDLGLTVHPTKSVLIPCQTIVFLGFVLCSITMTVRLTDERCVEIIELCKTLINTKRTTIRNFSQLIGKLVAAEQGVEYATLYIKPLEKIKVFQLQKHKGKFDSFMKIPVSIKPILNWWIVNLKNSMYILRLFIERMGGIQSNTQHKNRGRMVYR
ncbi:uncharacterized protein LOC128553983 [Mercenaria mercenaria]|uniref:uncharacterized protein LOC128553983 n=1 Tax=Mercenaria mercenaria TaxID=6596 RepID=UPI00234E537F|nr:uncharacterized protein LOC128553983 [Mercenaria mercenaria]